MATRPHTDLAEFDGVAPADERPVYEEVLGGQLVEPILAPTPSLAVHGYRVKPAPTLEDHDNRPRRWRGEW